ncbi:hypothetical protein [Fluviicola chungangensis]|uniref:Uncharacterized protein n=1 Tax=Fluviicola chungangensis TaxID=2597671 RepID=A0A556MYJ3_9FLAO|nr:hypothetical protein [Fluviicola chungangensis]TSJ44990.1 hypothetical protein FO442_10365 [Fluviicola chungangensis]
MKKICFLFVICFFSQGVFSQTSVFKLNQEKARYNQTQHTSQIVSNTFYSQTPVTQADLVQISAVMENKDGYVSCTLTPQNKLVVEHENWVETKDIVDVIGQFVPVKLEAITEYSTK